MKLFIATFLSLAFAYAFRFPTRNTLIRSLSIKVVKEVGSDTELDEIVKADDGVLTVVDYSTTWCGPCKIVAPKFAALSEKYPNVNFVKCVGDSSKEATALMKREGVRSVPTFHIWKNGGKIEVVNGARLDEVETAINSNS